MKENILNSFFFFFLSFRFVSFWNEQLKKRNQKKKKMEKEKEKCVPAGILSELENVNSMLRSETECAEDTTNAQAETEKPNGFAQEERAHHPIPLIYLFFFFFRWKKNCI